MSSYLHDYVSGKTRLNKDVIRLSHDGAVFHIHYWGIKPKHYDNILHKHSFLEVCYVVEGTGIYIEEDNHYPLSDKVMFLSRPEVPHQIKSEYGLFLLYIGFELIESESSDKWIKIVRKAGEELKTVLDVSGNQSITSLLWESLIIQAAKNEHSFSKPILLNLAGSLLLLIMQSFAPLYEESRQVVFSAATSPYLQQATLFICDNLSQPLKLSDVAGYLHISSRHLSRIFIKELGISYSEFVQNERVQHAATLLKTTDLPIKKVAETSGFTSVHYFTRVFADSLGESPGRFRSTYTETDVSSYKN